MDKIRIILTFDESIAQGVDQSNDSALIRIARKLTNNGSPMGRFVYIFYREKDTFPTRIFGALQYSVKKRLIYYPGLIIRKHIWSTDKNKEHLVGNNIDHITLDPDMKSWHSTSIASKQKDNYRTREIKDDVYYWFAMSVQSKECLQKTPKEIILSFDSPETDSNRRIDKFIESRHGSEWPMITMNEVKPSGCFIHFDFIVDMRIKRDSLSSTLKTQPPSEKPVTINKIMISKKVPVIHSEIKIPTFPGIVVINASYIEGELSSETFFGGF
jgi:hypothetical protein